MHPAIDPRNRLKYLFNENMKKRPDRCLQRIFEADGIVNFRLVSLYKAGRKFVHFDTSAMLAVRNLAYPLSVAKKYRSNKTIVRDKKSSILKSITQPTAMGQAGALTDLYTPMVSQSICQRPE